MKKNRLLLTIMLMLHTFFISAAGFSNKMEDSMYDSGRINVVIGVILIIFAFFILYLFRLDRKVSALEKEIDSMDK